MSRVCIICKQEKDGSPIIDDPVIHTIRKIKERLGLLKGNELVVCPDCKDKHKQRRARFERYLVIYSFLAAVAFILLLIASRSVAGIFSALLVALFVLSLGLFIYTPATAKN